MRKFLLSSAALFFMGVAFPTKSFEYTSFLRLNVNPDAYSGQEVGLIGYVRIDPSDLGQSEPPYEFCGMVMHDESTMRAIRVYEMVTFCTSLEYRPDHMQYRYIGIRGTFRVRDECPPFLKVRLREQPLGCLVDVDYIFPAEVEGLDDPMPPPEPEDFEVNKP
ncbi:hypothetical protein [Aliidiomarina haloalkalitolerans]|uniref:Uncharacterized protein n=1 Tax=Aliidiomarina haloalkalitolerans TaxID=859059 RepID=A0A432VPC0_9GAMM|nr:hypothetical protein [Aliidiomarina haloalkalitolerans]RUO17939.1 hypothetical protein CWE06_12415 [Aliidiomarina haloalkalitolerans]